MPKTKKKAPASSTTLDINDIANLLLTHGFVSQKAAEVGTAVVMAESGGRIGAVNINTDGSRDRGIWQINSRWHPEVTDKCAFNPACATTAAARISGQGMNFKPWAAYTNGAYKKHLGAAEAAVDRVRTSTTPGDIAGATAKQAGKVAGIILTPIEVLADLVRALLSGETWIRIGFAIGGAILIFLGLRWMVQHTGELKGAIRG